jgi:UTP--glucose-1-phosphate uridylyltransferase
VADTVQKGMLPIVDRDGLTKPVIQIIAEEALESGIEEICVVCAPGDADKYRRQLRLLEDELLKTYEGVEWAREQARRLDNLSRRLSFAVQEEPLGYGHAVYCARDFAGGEPFLLLLGDHLYVSNTQQRCAQQLMQLAASQACPVAAVHATREHLVGRYGTVSGKRVSGIPGAYQIEKIIEKPSVSRAELELQTPGLRSGHYLCFFGMHVLTHRVFELLEKWHHTPPTPPQGGNNTAAPPQGGNNADVQLTPALQELANEEEYLALEVSGSRYDIGSKYGLLQTQVALAAAGTDCSEMLTMVVDLLAEANQRRIGDAGKGPVDGGPGGPVA